MASSRRGKIRRWTWAGAALTLAGVALWLLVPPGPIHTPASAEQVERQPYLDPALPVERRARMLLERMTLREKVEQLHGTGQNHAARNERLGIPDFRPTDGPRGVGEAVWRYLMRRAGRATAFPAAIALAATWEPELAYETGAAIAREARASGRNWLLAPCVNIARDPRAGRTQEGYGEDPYLAARLAVAFVRGVQDQHVIATPKHFACANQETDRQGISAGVDERTLREIYLPAFEASVREGGTWAVMAAYNRVNGTPAFEHRHLLTEVLKRDWGFRGFVVSDWKSVEDVGRSIAAGLDVEMPKHEQYGAVLQRAVEQGRIPEATVDACVLRVLRAKLAAGLFDHPLSRAPEGINTEAHRELALDVAHRSIVLLKNDGAVLPLAGRLTRIAVIGPGADEPRLGDDGSSEVRPYRADSVLEGIRARAGTAVEVPYAAGCRIRKELSDGIRRAVELAGSADAAVVVVGLSERLEGEQLDRVGNDLRLPEAQENLIAAVGRANRRTVVVLQSGSAVDAGPWIEHARAVVQAWYPGERGGEALAGILFGDVGPSGRLPLTFPAGIEQLPAYPAFPGSGTAVYDEGVFVGYRHFDRARLEPLFPFGHGLDYTRFEYADLEIASRGTGRDVEITVTAAVRNVGERRGAEVAQLYVGDPQAALPRPPRELKGFQKVFLEPGETGRVRFVLDHRSLAFYDPDRGEWTAEPGTFHILVGSSSRDIRMQAELRYGS